MKILWSGIKSTINIKGKVCNISQLVQNLDAVKNPCGIAKIFNNYFVIIAAKIDSEIPTTKKSPLDNLCKKLDLSFFISPSDSSVENIISQFKNGKAVGPYNIPCKFA